MHVASLIVPAPLLSSFFYYCCRFLLLMVVVGDGSWYDDDDGRIYLLSPCFKSLFLLFKTEWTKKWKSNACLHDDSWMLENDLNWFWLCTTGDREREWERFTISAIFFSLIFLRKENENWKAHDTKAPRDKKIPRASTLEQMYMHGILHKLKTKQRNVFVCASFAVQWQWYQFFYAMNWIEQTARGFYYDNHKFYVPHPSELLGYLPNHHFNKQWNHINLLICLQKWRKSPEISITLNVNNCIRLKYSLD